MKTKMINRLIQETEQRLFESLSIDDKIYYTDILSTLQNYNDDCENDFNAHQFCVSEEDVQELNEEKENLEEEVIKLERKIEKIRDIIR